MPEADLVAAVLAQAVRDLRRPAGSTFADRQATRDSALRFFESDEPFRTFCGWLKLDPDAVLEGLEARGDFARARSRLHRARGLLR